MRRRFRWHRHLTASCKPIEIVIDRYLAEVADGGDRMRIPRIQFREAQSPLKELGRDNCIDATLTRRFNPIPGWHGAIACIPRWSTR